MSDSDPHAGGGDGPSLVADKEFPWQDGISYAVLNAQLKANNKPELGPASSANDVNNAGFTLQGAGRDVWQRLRPIWDRLRKAQTRLGIDFFHYPIADFAIDELEPESLERPMPVATADLVDIVGGRIELANMEEPPARIDTRPIATAELINFTIAELMPAPLSTSMPTLSEIIEADDDGQ
jgi:hypothetical protein